MAVTGIISNLTFFFFVDVVCLNFVMILPSRKAEREIKLFIIIIIIIIIISVSLLAWFRKLFTKI